MSRYGLSVLILSMLLSIAVYGQEIPRGSYLFGGNLNFSLTTSTLKASGINSVTGLPASSSTKQPVDLLISASPKLGYFLFKNFAAGIQVQYDYHVTSDSTNTSSLYVGPFIRYYVGVGDIVFLFAEVAPGFGVNTTSSGNLGLSASALSVGIGPGVVIFATKDIGVEAMVQYRYINQSASENGVKNTLTSGQVNFGLGFQYYIKSKVIGEPYN